MGIFSNSKNKARLQLLYTYWDHKAILIIQLIESRGLHEELEQATSDYFNQAIKFGRNSSLKGQLSGAKKSINNAFMLEKRDIVGSGALFIVGVYIELCVMLKIYPEFVYEITRLRGAVESYAQKYGGLNNIIEYKKMMGY